MVGLIYKKVLKVLGLTKKFDILVRFWEMGLVSKFSQNPLHIKCPYKASQ